MTSWRIRARDPTSPRTGHQRSGMSSVTDTDAIYTLFTDLPRQGPGSDAATLDVIRRLPPLPDSPTVLDIGCGSGKQTLVLARTLKVRIEAIDVHQPFLDQLQSAAIKEGLAPYIRTRQLSMEALDYAPESIDLIWSEGAVYIMGVSTALRSWLPLLRPGGFFVFSEATWLTENPPPRAAAFFQKCYPQMETVSGNLRRAKAEQYEVLETYTLPAQTWWDGFYKPLQERIEFLRPQAAAWPELAGVITETEEEISVFSQHSESYGYVFYILRRPAGSPR